MNPQQERELAFAIETALLETPGIAVLFPVDGAVSVAVDAGARLLGIRTDREPLVRVRAESEPIEVDASLGADGTLGAADTTRTARQVIRALLPPTTEARIRLTLAQIDLQG
ncbi:hypothetical protein J2Y69_002616 [Microbacterium resistens]|uniref:Uncharacterized protein n=1 Tax=Microbacterium resistens TaxID=156977 RepID=A0ABU1SFE4_9MICO|nr:hypothetical protein [Microbacterium resistens]MDR6868008.1 hypothetical protein [Microbacterium resistens]